ncbi:uncharacterized protein LOC110716688 [Chenopodium quinoa]|uniref:uncharacterized protein LOC110716688 n=1 Tax=Chenopodium quinoa TaxID=63459 RepID=UPI000B7785D1|nr:uncharacterized protein LOC110716688 [Chenopodium quinoa]
MDEVFMSNPIEIYQMLNQVPRAPRIPVPRDREDGHNRFWNDYFADHPVFPPQLFRRRFRMNKHIFLRIKQTLEERHPFFQQRQDATGRFGASGLQKCTAAMRLIAYGTSADSVDDYIRISASLARDSLQDFVEGIVSYFNDEYLRKPNEEDLVRLLRIGKRRGFPGSRNDINVLDRSPLFNDVFEGRAPSINYVVNDHHYNMGYYLTDGIYPKWAAFIPTISLPQNEKGLFAKLQEARRKDVERAFGVLQARFAIIWNPALARDTSMLGKIMIACIIMHNMIVEDERDMYKTYYDPNEYDQATNASSSNRNTEEPFQFENSNNRIASLEIYLSNRARVRDEAMHKALKKDLVENMWLKFGVHNRQNNLR